MYDNFKLLNYSNSLVSPELYARHLSRLFTGNVVDGLLVVPKTGLTVTLPFGNGLIPYGTGATASAREFSLVANFDITLDTADASNPRIDLIVIYVDMGVTLPGGTPTSANLDGPGVVKATFVKGTPNASPVDPTVGAIQTKIGASNPYIVVAAVRVDATVTTIAANKITDRRVFARVGNSNIADSAVTAIKTSFGGNFTTSEVDTGFTWVDGKTIYKKTIDIGSLPNNSTKNVAHGITGLTKVLSVDGTYSNGTITFPVNRPDPASTGVIYTFINGANITVGTSVDRTTFSGHVTLTYVK